MIFLENYDLFLFDLDDTLFDHSDAYKRGIEDTLEQFHVLNKVDHSEFFNIFTKHNHLLWPRFSSNELTFHEFSLMRLENTLKEFNITVEANISIQIVKTFQSFYLQRITPQQKINMLLKDLSKKMHLGIVTNGTVFNAYEKVERLGLSSIFPDSSIIVSEKVGFSKPRKEIFQHALNLFNGTPSRTLFIGDNYFTDITGAKFIGLDTLWINRYNYECPNDEQPDFMVENLLDFKGLIHYSKTGLNQGL